MKTNTAANIVKSVIKKDRGLIAKITKAIRYSKSPESIIRVEFEVAGFSSAVAHVYPNGTWRTV
jgi:hypothetical protein